MEQPLVFISTGCLLNPQTSQDFTSSIRRRYEKVFSYTLICDDVLIFSYNEQKQH